MSDKISIVCTTFPQYDWVREIIGEEAERFDLTLLLDNGVDLHNYQPTAEDVAKISSSDIFIYVGGESDGWVKDALKESANKKQKAMNLMEILGEKVKEEELVEGMEEEEHEDGDGDDDIENKEGQPESNEETAEEAEEHEEETEYDEHVWLSLKNVRILTAAIADAIEEADKEKADIYTQNAKSYTEELSALDHQYEEAVKKARRKNMLFGDRFPFRYLADDYGLDYYAAFVGCSAETEASFETITFLAGKVDELEIPVILTIENSDQKIADTISKNTRNKNQKILVMNSLQSVTSDNIQSGFTYLGAMKDNLEVLKQALN